MTQREVKSELFRGVIASWPELFEQAATFASRIGRDRLITISHSEDKDDGVVAVWYWSDPGDGSTGGRLQGATPVFLVGDIASTMEWYRSKLGFDAEAIPNRPPHDFCILRKNAVTIFLQQLTGYRHRDHYHEREGGVWSAYLETHDVQALYESLRGTPGVKVIQPLRHQPYGQWEFEVRDPDGYVLVFAEPG
jgi:uncharacterized glyoxalase superfamily protein PhnB